MKNLIKASVIGLLLLLRVQLVLAQPDIRYLDNTGVFKMGGGTLTPGQDFSKSSGNGLHAKPGHQVNFAFNYIISHGIGIGAHLDVNRFRFNEQSFLMQTNPTNYRILGKFASTKLGLNLVANVPIVIHQKHFTVNLFGEFQAGLRGMKIPSIDLRFSELENKFVEVNYRSRNNTMGYLGGNAGIQLLFSNKIGCYAAYHLTLRSRHSIKYSVRAFDASGQLYEDENYLNNYLDATGLQFGVFFVFGK